LLVLVSLSVLGLFAGAALVATARLRVSASAALEGLALGMLPTLVLARLLPHAYESLGFWAIVLAAIGFGLVTLSHHAGERAEARLGSALTLPALLLHAVTDGAALAMSATGRIGDSAGLLAIAAILHRVPEGFFVASRGEVSRAPTTGGQAYRAAILAAAPLAAATVLGALVGQSMFDRLPDAALDGVLALGAGAMLRLVSHSHAPTPVHLPLAARAAGVAALLLGIALVIAVPGAHDILERAQPSEPTIPSSLFALFVESAPAVLAAVVAIAMLRLLARHPWSVPPTTKLDKAHASPVAALLGWVLGARTQLRRSELLESSLRLRTAGASAAYLAGLCVAVTQLGIETAALSLVWLGPEITLARIAGSAIIALMLGTLCSRNPGAPRPVRLGESEAEGHARPTRTGVWEQLQHTLDENAAWLLLGLLLSAALEAMLAPNVMHRLPLPLATALAGMLGLFGWMSALGATPVVAVLVHKGLSLVAGLTFLWLTPLASVPLSIWLRGRLGGGRVLGCVAAAAVTVSALALLTGQLLSPTQVPELHALVTHDHAAWEYGCALALAALLLISLIRLGPRRFITGPSAGADSTGPAHAAAAPHAGHHHHTHTSHRVADSTFAAATAARK